MKFEAFYEQIKDDSSIEIELPLADQFWGGKMGVFTDKYGVSLDVTWSRLFIPIQQ